MPSKRSGMSLSSTFLEALALDVSILQALLQRHRTSHGRAVYYRRMMMVLKNIQKKNCITEAVSRLEILRKDVNSADQSMQRRNRKRRNLKDEEWSLAALNKQSSKEESVERLSIDGLAKELKELICLFTHGIQEIVSRICHASEALFLEVSRGFFLPFCTVALSSLARIRAMVMHVGRTGLTQLKNGIQPDMEKLLRSSQSNVSCDGLTTANYEKFMELLLDDDQNSDQSIALRIKPFDQNVAMASLGIPLSHEKRKRNTRAEAFVSVSVPLKLEGMNENDVGMAVDHSREEIMDEKVNDATTVHQTVAESSARIGGGSDMERNMQFVQSFQRKRRDSTQQQLVDPAESTGKLVSMETQPSRKSRKKKKRKNDTANFFDSLFDS